MPLLGIYPKELKAGFGRDICTPVFTVLFTTVKRWNATVHLWMNG